MSTEPHKHGQTEIHLPIHDDVSYEPRDVRVSPIIKFLVYLGIGTVFSFILAKVVLVGLTDYWQSTYAEPLPSQINKEATMPPEPRLQGMPGHLEDPQADWRAMKSQSLVANDSFGWVDRGAGVAQIPVKDAMKLIAEKGLPAIQAPVVPVAAAPKQP